MRFRRIGRFQSQLCPLFNKVIPQFQDEIRNDKIFKTSGRKGTPTSLNIKGLKEDFHSTPLKNFEEKRFSLGSRAIIFQLTSYNILEGFQGRQTSDQVRNFNRSGMSAKFSELFTLPLTPRPSASTIVYCLHGQIFNIGKSKA